jgi:hypothetical protein
MTEKLPYENWKGNLQEFVDAIVTGLRPHTNTDWPTPDTPEALTSLYKRCVDSEPSNITFVLLFLFFFILFSCSFKTLARRQSFQTILLTGIFEEIILQDLFPKVCVVFINHFKNEKYVIFCFVLFCYVPFFVFFFFLFFSLWTKNVNFGSNLSITRLRLTGMHLERHF